MLFDDFALSVEYHWLNASEERQRQLGFLYKFVKEKELLFLCSRLLPDLVKFYHWLHQKLTHLLTRNQACRLTIGIVIENVPFRYSQHHADEIRALFRRVRGTQCNGYLAHHNNGVRLFVLQEITTDTCC